MKQKQHQHAAAAEHVHEHARQAFASCFATAARISGNLCYLLSAISTYLLSTTAHCACQGTLPFYQKHNPSALPTPCNLPAVCCLNSMLNACCLLRKHLAPGENAPSLVAPGGRGSKRRCYMLLRLLGQGIHGQRSQFRAPRGCQLTSPAMSSSLQSCCRRSARRRACISLSETHEDA